MADAEGTEGQPKKKSAMMMTIIGLAVLTLLGGGGGWVVGGMIAPSVKSAQQAEQPAAAAEPAKAGETGLQKISTEANNVVQLEPITSNLAYPSENWVRLEVALLFSGTPDVKLAEDIHQDIMAYIRTVSLQQIEGPRGFEYLRDDIQERVDLRAQGRVSKVMFRTFVIE
ncbi:MULTISPECIES: flagellar basal body-associated FliL family protein [unclassified Rhizobium]|uniref:flagellar basal body-associated FliL family protein n=1 Tax=unclassified Rhizobium TaxID=2613769 RepID=UPI001ADB419E|nr:MULTISPECIES: flagellar basal body-associated FliL family protein [unclassified Rhizobium]MBO9122694.1 flagellar basal body-associated FliL family protein [Rhizobium sp. 16-488-2b]MBO9173226.1 flagellar basal body-associated FliL family protein [Rhizobium sp. 16-488-2a]